ncbi:MAG TPA: PIG-L family deacetylase [Steroidobacteraceae bacterium]|jgi:LmbE family N-acetylglucosaminyl deacetylase|nr:PIG-L family deacetylase [Steroidobacteraceae bacterium]
MPRVPIVALLTLALWTARPADAALPLMAVPGANDRVLVIAPHPDDESLCCAGLIQQTLNAGASVGIVWITAGDGFELDALVVERTLSPGSAAMQRLGKQRLREAHAAADALGVPRASQYVLGYPDRGVAALIGPYYQRPYRSRYTASTTVRYAGAVSPGASYTGANLERDLEQVMAEFRPTLVLAAAPQDLHPDHRASGELVRRMLEARGELPALRYWIIHARGWPRPYGLEPQLPLAPPAIAASLAWQSLPLSAGERALKLAALREHASQIQLMSPLMQAFVRANELFAQAAP